MSRRRHHRWSTGLVGTLLVVSVGLLYAEPSVLVLGIVPLGYVVYDALSSYPDPTLGLERTVSTEAPTPGTTVTVKLTVTNTGDRMLPDVSVIDGVPGELTVVDGAPRASLSIPAGESRTFSYAVMTKRGDYEFGEATVRVRSLSGSRVVTTRLTATNVETLSCSTAVDETPLSRATQSRTGTLPTDSGGPGLEFHSTREYRPGDPTNRIDWRRFARTDELSTINFREERAARLVVVVDARPPTRIAPHPGYPTGTELSGYAAERLYASLTAAGHQVGVTAIGLDDVDVPTVHPAGQLPWIDPPADGGSAAQAHELFEAVQRAATREPPTPADTASSEEPAATETTASPADPTEVLAVEADGRGVAPEESIAQRLRAQLPPDAQVVFVTPLLDAGPLSLVETIRTHGVPTTVLSPDVTPTDTLGGRVETLQRDNRIAALRVGDASVVDWPVDEPLDIALEATRIHR